MLRRILFGLLLVVQAVSDAMAIGVSHNPQATDVSGNSAAEQYEKGKQVAVAIIEWLDLHNGAVGAAATIAIAIFTYFLVKVTGTQARLTREGLDLARQEFIATHRPRVVARWFEIEQPIEGEVVKGHFTIVNTGITPAFVTRIGADAVSNRDGQWLADAPESAAKSLPKIIRLESGEAAICPFASKHPLFEEPTMRETHGGITMIQTWPAKPEVYLYVAGEIIYNDLSGIERHTGFLRRFDPRSNLFMPGEGSEYEYAD
jgi:hypothetical protein